MKTPKHFPRPLSWASAAILGTALEAQQGAQELAADFPPALPLTDAEIDRLAEERGEARLFTPTHANIHE